ncbi:putative ferric-chelate reductase 1 isoform X2 [Periophthalmus magnuspinnatus]|uniref:putative ferric-chelate reductase 1 isoform X2 n=1 Tax=Periophthalmus magnuspinnatus TaxID=409849 RepID=UPI00243635E1|nr:putative ferric-chelate reductase 1 isoform X2 [Periophthalmus magnuspinnatus]
MEGKGVLVALVLLLLGCRLGVEAFQNGKVTTSCKTMIPGHEATSPQNTESPFTVSTQKTSYMAGQDVTVILSTSSPKFEGFLLQAREEASGSAVGSFVSTPVGTQTLTCGGVASSALSHTSNVDKSSVQVTWRPTSNRTVQFYTTFVQSYQTYWVGVASPKVEFTGEYNSNDNSNDNSNAHDSSTARPSTLPATPLDISSGGCGESKVCFLNPPDCDPAQNPANCYFLSATLVSPGSSAVQYQMSGPSDGYISFGFSDDQEMGNDDIYICVMDDSGLVQLQHAYSTGSTTPQSVPLGNISDIQTSVENKVIRCSFISTNSISTQRSSSSQAYYLLYAHGPSSNGQIKIHTGTFVSRDRVDITKPGQVQSVQAPAIIKAHGALMLVAWMFTGSLGMIVARFNKKLAHGTRLCGKDMWFLVHVLVMCLTVAMTIIAFILVFAHVRTWSGGAHPVLGCLVMILSFFQPLGALLRCGPQHPKRFLFNWSHALNALAIKALSVAAIFTGLQLIDSSQNQWLPKVMGGFVAWEAVYFLLSDLNLKWSQKSEGIILLVMGGPLVPGLFLLGNLAFLVALLAGIGMS